jgi:hypothetical protein
MSKHNYKKLYEEAIFDKINLEKIIEKNNIEFENIRKNIDYNNINYKELYDKLLIEHNELKDKLKKYTSPERNKKYYEKNKEKIIEKVRANQKKSSSEKIKEYNKKSYQNRKLKKQLEEQNNIIQENENIKNI